MSLSGSWDSRCSSWATIEVRDLIVDRRAEEDDPLVEQPREDVELALAAGGALDDHRDERHVRPHDRRQVGRARRAAVAAARAARSIRRASLRRSSRSVAATSAGSVRSIEHRQQREVLGVDAMGGGVELLAVRAAAARCRRGDARAAPRRAPPAGAAFSARARRRRRRAPSPASVGSSTGAVEHDPGGGGRARAATARAEPSASAGADRAARRPGAGARPARGRRAAPTAEPTGTSPGSVRNIIASPARTAG